MFRRLQHLVRNQTGPHLKASDFDGVHDYLTSLRNVFYDAHGECRIAFAVVEIVNNSGGYPVGHITWDGEAGALRFRPCVPDDTAPIPLP